MSDFIQRAINPDYYALWCAGLLGDPGYVPMCENGSAREPVDATQEFLDALKLDGFDAYRAIASTLAPKSEQP